MLSISLLLVCLLSGILLRRGGLFDETASVILNRLIIYFFVPVLTLYHVPGIVFKPELIWLSLSPILVYLAGFFLSAWRGEYAHSTAGLKGH